MKAFCLRFFYAFSGIARALTTDTSFRFAFGAGGMVTILTTYIFWPLTPFELWFLWISWLLVLITELQNTSFERALDRLHPDRDQSIGSSKDMAAGAVLIAFLLFCAAIGNILIHHIDFGL